MRIKRVKPVRRRGYTLLELTLAMSIGMMVATMSLLLLNQQMAFMRIFRAQDFLTREAPVINNYVVRVIGAAEGYRLYTDLDSMNGGGDPVLADAKVLVLRFREADGTVRASVLSFEGAGDDAGLYYRVVPENGVLGDPDWAVSKQATAVSFSVEQGVLRMRLDGPNGESLVYSGTQQS